jgi:hypothetical protein
LLYGDDTHPSGRHAGKQDLAFSFIVASAKGPQGSLGHIESWPCPLSKLSCLAHRHLIVDSDRLRAPPMRHDWLMHHCWRSNMTLLGDVRQQKFRKATNGFHNLTTAHTPNSSPHIHPLPTPPAANDMLANPKLPRRTHLISTFDVQSLAGRLLGHPKPEKRPEVGRPVRSV